MKRLIIIMLAALLCVGCNNQPEPEVTPEDLFVQNSSEDVYYGKGLRTYTNVFPDGTVYWLYRIDRDTFFTVCESPNEEMWNYHEWDRSYPQQMYDYWMEEGSEELANYYRDNYNSMIACFDNDTDTCVVYVAEQKLNASDEHTCVCVDQDY